MAGNPIKPSSRDYSTIMADINSDSTLVDKPDWFKRIIAGGGDVADLYLNASYNDNFLRTSFLRNSVSNLLELIDYYLSGQSTSSGIVLYYWDAGTGVPFTLTTADLVASTTGSLITSAKRFEARASVNFNTTSDTFTTNFAANNNLTISTDFGYTGHKARVTTTGTLPSGLAIDTDYYVIYKSSTTIALATSLINAIAGTEIALSSDGSGTHTITLYSQAVTSYQQETRDQVVLGQSDGSTEFQEFTLPDQYILSDTLLITINSVSYTNNLTVESISTDTHYRLLPLSDNNFKIQFGNGTYGIIPPAGFDILADYATGGGADANVTASNTVTVYGGSDSRITAVSNASQSITGGADEETIESGKVLGPLLLKAQNRFITTSDGEALTISQSGIAQAKVVKNYAGPLSAQILTIANGGGSPSAAIRTALDTYLTNLTILESIDVDVPDTTSNIITQNVTSSAKVVIGYDWTTQVKPYFDLAWRLFFTETSREILEEYSSNGIANAVILINNIFSTSFGTTDYDVIRELLNNGEARNFGDIIQESDAYAYIQGTLNKRIDYMEISAPTFPISLTSTQITTDGTITTSEIT